MEKGTGKQWRVLVRLGEGDKSIDLLIGADVMGKLLTGRKYDCENGLTALETRLGWTVMGKCNTEISRCDTVLFNNDLQIEEASVSNLWQLDVLGIQDPLRRKTREEREAEVKKNFRETVIINDENRYEVSLPWIQEHALLGSNKALCIKRLENTMKDLEKRGLVDEYGKIFREWEREGIIEKVPDNESNNPSHYLPHRPIVKPNSVSTRIRPVFDAASRERNSPSINQCLDKGPNLMELIPTVLLGFRKEEVGVTADVKAAFLQISVAPSDRDYLRFLWRSGDKVITYRHKRVVFGLTCSPFLLGATIKFHLEKINKNETNVNISDNVIMKMADCFYSDNCVTSVKSQEDFVRFKSEATDILGVAGFDLRRWECTGDNNDNSETSVLGLVWNKVEDTLSVNLASIPSNLECHDITKRFILSVAQRVFDPIGFSCPVMLYPKLLIQKIWKENAGWDSALEGEIKSEFHAWIKSLSELKDVKIPRKLGAIREDNKISFHVFADASGHAYAAVVFIRTEYAEKTEVQLIGAKSRVVPTKEMTIHRLELLAATIAARLAKSLIDAFNFENPDITYWSDSSAVLTWINQETQWSTFVWNRVQEIRQLTAGTKWRHVPGTLNPADLPSRGYKAAQLLASRWWEGPDWLKLSRSAWPSAEFQVIEDEVNCERKKTAVSSTILLSTETDSMSDQFCKYFSDYGRIVKMVAWIQRFINNLKCREKEKRILTDFISSDDFKSAAILLLKVSQRQMFVNKNEKKLKCLNVFKDENELLRIKTKVFNRMDERSFRCPVVLDSSHPIVTRIIEDEHRNLKHAGCQILLCNLREKYWILSARKKVRSILSKCMRCKRYTVKRMEAAKAPLPIERVRDAGVFEVVGVDLAGPLYLKGNEKAYVCLFTCAVYRAIHLELLLSLSTASFIKGFYRLIARRGRPVEVFSDNGTNFLGTENNLKKLNWEEIEKYSATKRIKWHFNPPASAWWGGWWERLIRIVKQVLRGSLGKTTVDYENMITILCDCEAIVNSRPLTYMSTDSTDLVPLTPNMFLRDLAESQVVDFDAIEAKGQNSFTRECKC